MENSKITEGNVAEDYKELLNTLDSLDKSIEVSRQIKLSKYFFAVYSRGVQFDGPDSDKSGEQEKQPETAPETVEPPADNSPLHLSEFSLTEVSPPAGTPGGRSQLFKVESNDTLQEDLVELLKEESRQLKAAKAAYLSKKQTIKELRAILDDNPSVSKAVSLICHFVPILCDTWFLGSACPS